MALQKVLLKPGVNKEQTRYTDEGRWYDCDKVRFRQGLPEKIGGWQRTSTYTYLGTARSLFNWVTLGSQNLVAVGTNLKYYIEQGGEYYDITPIRSTTAAGDVTFSATDGSSTITVSDTDHGAIVNDFVTFSGAVSLGGNITADVLNQEYQVSLVVDADTYEIVAKDTGGATVTANASDSGNGGASVVGAYQINTGPELPVPLVGWGAGGWGLGPWGTGTTGLEPIRLWSQSNFGEDLIFGPRGGEVFIWDASVGIASRGTYLSAEAGASNVPVVQNIVFVSDNRFVFCFGANDIGSSDLDPMLIRWSDQEDATNWTPAATNQAGSLRLSTGSEIITAIQSRQEILTWTDSAVYSIQYLGAPAVWGAQLLADNTSIVSPRAAVYASGVAFWMGRDKFYRYDGRVQPLRCDLLRYVFNDFNLDEVDQVFAGTNEEYQEIWWFYCSAGSQTIDKYVVYNYMEDIWYYGTLARTAWSDTGLRDYPIGATYSNNLVYHELGVDDDETGTPTAINAYITSSEFDLDDGHKFAFIWRVLPDITFDGSTAESPQATLTLLPLAGSGSGYNSPASEGGTNAAGITRSATVPVEAYTNQLNVRVRGRQLSMKIASDQLGVQWQLGAPRLDMRPDGRR
jgi:hypothetical protein